LTDDAEWIRRWRETEDEEAASWIFQKYYKGVYNYAYQLLRNHHDAEEVAMDTFEKAFRKLETLKEPAKLGGWLCVIAHRRILNRQRDLARQLKDVELMSLDDSVGESEEAVSIADIAAVHVDKHTRHAEARQDRIAVLKRLIRLLPEQDRQVMERYHLEELTYKEIAALSTTTEKSVESRLARTRKLLKAIVTQFNDLLNLLSNAEALMMRRYLLDRFSHAEIAEFLGISPQEVADGLEHVMERWKKIITQQKRTDPVTTPSSQRGVILNLWLSFVKRVTRFMLH